MKTIYQKPETEMIILNVQQMVCASGEGGLLGSGSEPEDLDLGNAGTSGATSGNLSRRSLWDDDEE